MRTNIFFIFLFNILHSIYSQPFDFSHLDNSDGLSNNQVECIFKDSRGFIWFGTNSGLNRYDGQNFKIYKHIKDDPESIPYNKITNIKEDKNGNLILSSTGGTFYSIYNYKTESFIANIDSALSVLNLPPSPSIIEIDAEKNLYLYYNNKGIYKYDYKSGKQNVIVQGTDANAFSEGEIVQLKVRNGCIWILFKDGLLERFNEKENIIDIRNNFFKENSLNSTIDKTLFIDSDNDLWIYPSVADRGVSFFDTDSKKWTLLDSDSRISLSSSFIRAVIQDNNNLIWIATDHGGINIFDKKKQNVHVLKNDIYNPNSIRQNSIISLFCDNDGIVWAGSYKNGVSYYHPHMFKFKKTPLFLHFKEDQEVFDCNVLLKDKNDNLWIGTNGRGLIKYNENNDNFRMFRSVPGNKNSLSSDIITAINEDHAGIIWAGTFLGGMNAFNGKEFTRYQIDENNPNSLSSKSVYGICEDNDNNLWIATLGGGLNKLDASRTNFTRYNRVNTPTLSSNFILSISTDKFYNIYLSSDQGVYLVDSKERRVQPYFKDQALSDSLTNSSINNAIVDSRNLLWIATDNGINVFNPTNRTFTYFTTKQGLPSDEVVSLIEDDKGNIWAGTRNGLSCINCTFKDNRLNGNITYFDTNDGLPGSVCNQNAMFKDKNGVIYVGCTKGYVSFHPDDIVFNKYVPKPGFTDLIIANQPITPNLKYKNRVIIDRSINDLNKIILNYNETNFTLLFSAFNYLHPEKNRYRYMLEGLDKEWTEGKNGLGAASYSNLNPGTYKLVVYAGNDDGIWSDKPLLMEIIVKPPFWLTWWAYGIYLILTAAIIRLFVKYKLDKQKYEFEQAQKIMEANKTHEIDELKFRFFTNISHEFKTPITLIITPLEKLLKEPVTDDQRNLLNIMRRNAQSLLNMVNEILEFRKFDLKKMSLNLSAGDIIPFIKDICFSFSELATEKSIKLTFTTYLDELQMDFDPEKMKKIITNLISNAFKFTEKGHIDVSIGIAEAIRENENKMLSIKISDTGIGIEDKYSDKIFERFFRIENPQKGNQSGTGVGLHLVSEYVKLHNGEIQVESSVGKGSLFTVLIPINNSSFREVKNQDIIHTGEGTTNESQKQSSLPANNDDSKELPILLVVDDNKDFRDFMKSLFAGSYKVVTANDGEDAYEKVLKELPDLILCDVMMPIMDGYEFCRKVKEDIRTSHIPIILLTAKSSEENQFSGLEAGADDYISKPFNIDMLTLKISKIIERQKKNQNNFKKKIDISPGKIQIMTMDEKFVKKAVAIVEENIGNAEFLVEDLCREMGMSRVYFYKKLLALTDKSPSEFIRFIRLKRAADLLEKSQMFVNEVAFQVGFNDPKYFRKYFKEEFGLTPNEYKKKFSGEE